MTVKKIPELGIDICPKCGKKGLVVHFYRGQWYHRECCPECS